MFVLLGAIVEETASFRDFIYGTTEHTAYDNWVSHVIEGVAQSGFNQYPPWDKQKPGFGSFKKATHPEATKWKQVVAYFANEQYEEAEDLIQQEGFPYEIVRFNDTDTDRTYYMLRELLNLEYFDDNGFPENPELHQVGSFDYGWGIYVIDPSSNIPLIVNVVHPNDDFIAPPFAADAFQMWNARFFMVSGVGREVLWTNEPPYFNSKSLSDPSRNTDHAFNRGYQAVCDSVREKFNRRELSVQLHSFDRTHMGLFPLQISSTGPDHTFTSLPSRDLSGNYRDLINFSPYVIHPANTIGLHEEILVTDYYAVNYSEHGMYYNNNGELLPISNEVSLASFKTNQQMLYSNEGTNLHGTYNPFFHIELDELPRCYPKTDESYDWFYGYDAETKSWDKSKYFERMFQFYRPWMVAFNEIFPVVLELNDYQDPTPPTELLSASFDEGAVYLEWERSFAFDFDSYEIYYSTEPNISDETSFFDEKDIPVLACQATNSVVVNKMPDDQQYYFRIRARDLNGNYTELSNEVTRYCDEVNIVNFNAIGRDEIVELEWGVVTHNNLAGFNLWRSVVDLDDFVLVSSWEEDESLREPEEQEHTFSYEDKEVGNGVAYDYRLSIVNLRQEEYFYPLIHRAEPEKIYTISINNDTGSISSQAHFGFNRAATDEFDYLFDEIAEEIEGAPYIIGAFNHPFWPEELKHMSTDIYAHFDPLTTFRVWNLLVETSEVGKEFTISLVRGYPEEYGPLFLIDADTKKAWDLTEETCRYIPSNTEEKLFYLYMGKVPPRITVATADNKFYSPGETFSPVWSIENGMLIKEIELLLTDGNDYFQIAESLEPTRNRYDWTVSEEMPLAGAKLVVRAHISDSEYFDFYSPYSIGVAPNEIEFSNVAGWHLKANPHTTYQEPGKTYFGDKVKMYRYANTTDSFIESTSFAYDRGYWVYMPEDFETVVEGPVQKNNVNQIASKGWNLLSNPYCVDLRVQDLTFFKSQKEYTYFEAIRASMILPVVFGAKNNCYAPVETIKAGEGYWIYSNTDALAIRYKVLNQNDDYVPIKPEWTVKVVANKEGHLNDEVVIGYAPYTDESYNVLYDLPKPSRKPLSKFDLYLRPDSEEYPFERLYSNLKRELRMEHADEVYWDFILETEADDKPVGFSILSNNIPEGYKVALIVDGEAVEISEAYQADLIPQSGLIVGQIMLTNGTITSAESNIPTPEILYNNFPNPFFISGAERSVGTVIPFNIEKPTKARIDVFNIKGQRVATLLNDKLESGYHQVVWDGRDTYNRQTSAGVYFYKLTTESGYSEIKKMLLLK